MKLNKGDSDKFEIKILKISRRDSRCSDIFTSCFAEDGKEMNWNYNCGKCTAIALAS